MGEGSPGSCQSAVHPTARHQVPRTPLSPRVPVFSENPRQLLKTPSWMTRSGPESWVGNMCRVLQSVGGKREGAHVHQAKEADPHVWHGGAGIRGHPHAGRRGVPLRPERGGRGLAADRQRGVCRDG